MGQYPWFLSGDCFEPISGHQLWHQSPRHKCANIPFCLLFSILFCLMSSFHRATCNGCQACKTYVQSMQDVSTLFLTLHICLQTLHLLTAGCYPLGWQPSSFSGLSKRNKERTRKLQQLKKTFIFEEAADTAPAVVSTNPTMEFRYWLFAWE